MRASAGGTLSITRSITGGSAFVAEGGTISFPSTSPVIVDGSTLDIGDGGGVQVGAQARVNITNNTTANCAGLLRGCIPPVLNLTTGAGLSVGGNLQLTGVIDLDIVAGADVDLAGNFDNHCTSPATFDWDAGPLTMNGATPQMFESAGLDLGPRNAAGFVNNFAMGTLRIEPARAVSMVNAFDNQPPAGCEVLYIDTLSLGAGCTLTLTGCNVYYNTLVRESGATVILQSGAALMSTSSGDLDDDNVVDSDDRDLLVTVALDGSCDPLCLSRADLNGDGIIKGLDITLFARVMMGWN